MHWKLYCERFELSENYKQPKSRWHITWPPRDNNVKDHCHTVLNGAYHSVPCTAFGCCGQCLIHSIPTTITNWNFNLQSLQSASEAVDKWGKGGAAGLFSLYRLDCFFFIYYLRNHRWLGRTQRPWHPTLFFVKECVCPQKPPAASTAINYGSLQDEASSDRPKQGRQNSAKHRETYLPRRSEQLLRKVQKMIEGLKLVKKQ